MSCKLVAKNRYTLDDAATQKVFLKIFRRGAVIDVTNID
jgi:hypothetical protein